MAAIPAAPDENDIAIVAMACRFPGAATLEAFWDNLVAGRESIRRFSESELLAAGADPAALADPRFVSAKPVLENVESFDAGYFGMSPREAELADPQHRIFLELAAETLERGGLNPNDFNGLIGVFAGAGISTYLLRNLLTRPEATGVSVSTGNLPDCLATRVAYKLNLRGPAYAIQCACSTSLVAIHAACQALLNDECDAALAGGVAVSLPQEAGYLSQEDGALSPDGHCRPFDARAGGTIFGNGAGAVLLMRLGDAQKGGFPIAAVLRGTAVNNDGGLKAGFTAPSQTGQAEVIRQALANAGIESAEAISYVEAHGTATPLGDPIEVAALTAAFRSSTEARAFCALGSVKSNFGHLDTAGGVAGLIKTVLALRHSQIPPSLNFQAPNPKIDFAESPFVVNPALKEWPARLGARRAGVSSFGVGGTNAHVILEEAPVPPPSGESRSAQLLVLSARTAGALNEVSRQLAGYLAAGSPAPLPDVAHTLQRGRRCWEHRRILVARTAMEAATALQTLDPARVATAVALSKPRRVAFLFPGLGVQFAGMGQELYREEPVFRREVDRSCELLRASLGVDLRQLLFASESGRAAAAGRLQQPGLGEPALFVISHALARLWLSWGIQPQSMIGHSVGEYVAACLGGVFSLEDALQAVATRARLIQGLPPGAMLAVPLAPDAVRPLLPPEASLAIVNAPQACVVSGSPASVQDLAAVFQARDVPVRLLDVSRALHSPMIEAALPEFARALAKIRLQPPAIPFISSLTGRPITPEQACDPGYWVRQMRQTVYFADGVGELLKDPDRILLEVGPGMTLSNLARQNLRGGGRHVILNSLPDPRERRSEMAAVLNALGRLWLAGIDIDWARFSAGENRRRIELPTYPFERQRCWIDPDPAGAAPSRGPLRKNPPCDWCYVPVWKQAPDYAPAAPGSHPVWLVLGDDPLFAQNLSAEAPNADCLRGVSPRAEAPADSRRLDPTATAAYAALLDELAASGQFPSVIVDAWSVGEADLPAAERFQRLYALAQALSRRPSGPKVRVRAIIGPSFAIRGDEVLDPDGSILTGLTAVMSQEMPAVDAGCIDVEEGRAGRPAPPARQAAPPYHDPIRQIAAELTRPTSGPLVAFRGGLRWTRQFERVPATDLPSTPSAPFKTSGVYLITGGLGGLGLAVAESLAEKYRANLVLVSRSALPLRDSWPRLLAGAGVETEVRARLQAVQRMEEKGSRVLLLSADVSVEAEIRGAVAAAVREFGRIDGAVHAAGLPGGGLIPVRPWERCREILAPKVAGASALASALAGEGADSLLLFSSLASLCGGLGQADYAAANAFLDAFAWSESRNGRMRVHAIDWDLWAGTGMAGRGSASASNRSPAAPLGMSPAEGVEALYRAMALGAPQVAISTVDLGARIETSRVPVAPAESASATRHARPTLATDYVGPSGSWEERLAELWAETLGFDRVGALDNFFDLGGDSLSALAFTAALRRRQGRDLPLTVLYEFPTIRLLARRLAQSETNFSGSVPTAGV